jgi:protein SCO1/2
MPVSLALALGLLVSLASAGASAAGGEQALPAIGPAPGFTLTSQDNEATGLEDFRGKVVAVAFIFTTCGSICPLLTAKMVEVQNQLGADFGAKVAFVSVTLHPEHDTPEMLKRYAEAYEANPAGWRFLTGEPAAVREVVRRYGVFAAKAEDGGIDHTSLVSIIDRRGILRVQYMGVRFDAREFRSDLLSLVNER